METNEIGVFETKTHLSEILERVRAGERFTIMRRGTPIAELRPIARTRLPLARGCARNEGYAMAADFDAPLDDLAKYS